ncbi:hypothetical protein MSG28_006736 [Choristoneura fumiferana]|uniref:Uncharacterized protein n=1 Tax=Choristoneura fumiferana TaxID=7141 RepID=A0ACC0JKZ7_CHOFU|nr:hypothetical protein MSG28_006736 [Choristoneura fumiferana]
MLDKTMARKKNGKRHPDIKRQICKKCRCTLILGQTATMKIKHKQKHKTVEWTCNTCNSKKCFLANGKKEPLWLERPEAVVEASNPEPQLTRGHFNAIVNCSAYPTIPKKPPYVLNGL